MSKMDMYKIFHNNKEYFEDFISRNTYHSNAIEGSTLTYADTYAIIFNDNSYIVKAEPREIYEAINHKYALDYALNNMIKSDYELKAEDIIKINSCINKNINEFTGYRKGSVAIRGASEIPPKSFQVPSLMMQLIYDFNSSDIRNEDLFKKIAQFHIQFEHIHPFDDGNGRTGRILINQQLMKNGLAPIVIAKEDKSKYIEYLDSYNIEEFAKFIEELELAEEKRIEAFSKENNI